MLRCSRCGEYIEQARQRTVTLRESNLQFLIDYLRTHPCVDCGERDPLVLEFDHRRDKSFNVSHGLASKSWQRILLEIGKCEVVCANCHRKRTARSGRFRRAVVLEADGPAHDSEPKSTGIPDR